jgi:MYXO-CTERM domain-containing protein
VKADAAVTMPPVETPKPPKKDAAASPPPKGEDPGDESPAPEQKASGGCSVGGHAAVGLAPALLLVGLALAFARRRRR